MKALEEITIKDFKEKRIKDIFNEEEIKYIWSWCKKNDLHAIGFIAVLILIKTGKLKYDKKDTM